MPLKGHLNRLLTTNTLRTKEVDSTMVVKSHGPRARTRDKLKSRQKYSITKYVQKFSVGEKAAIVIDPSSHRGLPFARFKGLMGTVVGKQGSAYIVQIREMGREKKVITFPEHLKAARRG